MSKVRYSVEGDEVYYTHHYVGRRRVEGADAATFTPLLDAIQAGTSKDGWHFAGKDRASVWFMHTRIDGADAGTFRFFHGGQCRWGSDAGHVYCLYVSERPRVKVVKTGAAGSLRFLDEPIDGYLRQYALTDTAVYYYGRLVRGADPGTFRALPKDRFDEPPGQSAVYRDARAAYYFGRKLDGIDPDALIVFQHPSLRSRVYAIDPAGAYVVDATTRTPGRDVSGTPFTRIPLDEVHSAPAYQQVRDYLARRVDLDVAWFPRT